jgi:phosphomannomutase
MSNRRWRIVPAGHAGIKREMRRWRTHFAAERSGHYYFNPEPQLYMDSGILAALAVISLVSRTDPRRGFAAEIDGLPRYCRSGERSFRAKNPVCILDAVERAYRLRGCTIARIDGITAECDTFWLNLRESGTENVLRLNAEAASLSILDLETRRLRRMLAH